MRGLPCFVAKLLICANCDQRGYSVQCVGKYFRVHVVEAFAIGYAFSTVLVAAPGLPNTGFPPRDAGIPWGIIALAGIGISASVSLIVVLKRRRI